MVKVEVVVERVVMEVEQVEWVVGEREEMGEVVMVMVVV
jgi:hypothetical protein